MHTGRGNSTFFPGLKFQISLVHGINLNQTVDFVELHLPIWTLMKKFTKEMT